MLQTFPMRTIPRVGEIVHNFTGAILNSEFLIWVVAKLHVTKIPAKLPGAIPGHFKIYSK